MEGTISVDRDAGFGEPVSPTRTLQAMQELLDRVTAALENGQSMPTQPGDEPVAAHHIASELYGLIERIRARYRSLADREIARAFRAITSSAGSTTPATGGPIRLPRELEMLVLGQSPQPSAPPQVSPQRLDEPSAWDGGPLAGPLEPSTNRDVSQPHLEPVGDRVSDQAGERVADEIVQPPAVQTERPVDRQVEGQTDDAPETPPVELPEGMFDGAVRLTVFSQGNMQRVVRFVDSLAQRPQLRVLRMTGNPQQEAAEIDIGLREPIRLMEVLTAMGHGVEPKEPGADGMPRLSVRLETETSE